MSPVSWWITSESCNCGFFMHPPPPPPAPVPQYSFSRMSMIVGGLFQTVHIVVLLRILLKKIQLRRLLPHTLLW